MSRIQKTNMRYIRFPSIEGYIDANRVRTLQAQYRIRPELARTLQDETISKPADLFYLENFIHEINPVELWRFVARLKTPPMPDKRVKEQDQILDKYSRSSFGRREYEDNDVVFFISDHKGDIISASYAEETGNFDYVTVRLCGYTTWELSTLAVEQLKEIQQRLLSPTAILAGLVWYEHLETNIQGEHREIFTRLSQLLRSIQGFIAPRQYVDDSIAPSGVTTPGGGIDTPSGGSRPPSSSEEEGPCPWDAEFENGVNGCTCVPDFNFKDCCDTHDLCYIEGCTGCERLECDIALYECILRRTGLQALAWLYYVGVRTLGALRFNFCDDESPSAIAAGVGGLVGAGVGVGVAFAIGTNTPVVLGVGGLLVGATIGGDLAVRLQRNITRTFCDLCEVGIEMEEVCDEEIERRRVERRRRHEERKKKCKKKKRWWKRLWCKIKTYVRYIIEVIWDEIRHLICKMVATALQATC